MAEQNSVEYLSSIIEIKKLIESLTLEVSSLKKEIVILNKKVSNNVTTLLETQTKLIHTQLNAPIPSITKIDEEEKPKPKKINGIEILVLEDSIKVSGNTFSYRDQIKSAASGNAKWENETKSWVLSKKCLKNLTTEFQNTNLVKDKDFFIKNEDGVDESVSINKKKVVKKIEVDIESDEECLF